MTTAKEKTADCLRAYPARAAVELNSLDDQFWERAEDGGVAVVIAQQLGVRIPRTERAHLESTVASMRSQAVTEKLLTICDEMGIRALPLKGPYLAHRLYGDASWRPTSDVDLLVAPRDAPRLVARLAREGGEVPEAHVHAFYMANHHHLTAVWMDVLIEIHFRATSSFGVRMESEPLLERATAARVAGRQVLILDPTDELIYLATHAAAHYCAHDILLLDLKLFVARYGVDWREVERRAHALHLDRAVGCALVAAERRTGLDTSSMREGWRAKSRDVLRFVPADLPPGYVDDWRIRARAHLAHAQLCATKRLAAAALARDALRAVKRRVHAAFPRTAPTSWEV